MRALNMALSEGGAKAAGAEVKKKLQQLLAQAIRFSGREHTPFTDDGAYIRDVTRLVCLWQFTDLANIEKLFGMS